MMRIEYNFDAFQDVIKIDNCFIVNNKMTNIVFSKLYNPVSYIKTWFYV